MEKWGHFAHENLSVLHFTKEENTETVFKSVKIFQTHNSHSLFAIYIIFDLVFRLVALCLNVYIYFVFLEQFIPFLMLCFGFFVFGLVVRSFTCSIFWRWSSQKIIMIGGHLMWCVAGPSNKPIKCYKLIETKKPTTTSSLLHISQTSQVVQLIHFTKATQNERARRSGKNPKWSR